MITSPSIFISYAKEDAIVARRLANTLSTKNVKLWIDTDSLLPGEEWKGEIRKAIRSSNFFIALLSKKSVNKKGYVQKEIREAIEVRNELPEGRRFILPARIDDCQTPFEIIKKLHWVDLFPEWDVGVNKLLLAIGVQQSINDTVTSNTARNEKRKRPKLKVNLSDDAVDLLKKLQDESGTSQAEAIRKSLALLEFSSSKSTSDLAIVDDDGEISRIIVI